MNQGIVLLAVTTSATIFLGLSALGAVDAADSDLLFGAELASSQAQRHLLSLAYTAVNRNSFATLSTTMHNTRAATTGATCSKCQWQLVTLSPPILHAFHLAHHRILKDMLLSQRDALATDTQILMFLVWSPFSAQVRARLLLLTDQGV